ncbi:signal recognition particle receptor subunit beta [Trypanosoma rangeli]|uniref:Signal recognition particle receptor subunit beta n=1 Tax=Trypanosoma rangeli TaxID=5698 RepID=A0A422N9N7_TRYRA|nr:signal recognition particle receptor subunit beta [Trypanosoma rangeli]RNF02161.1 signal recognition particle receptor subunit beta [Trypanosoma rangeli]|eukprot:RNF02161.1 signal recognition particle receptor subunit beta [Trypanosoma rangeli]
MSLEQLEVGGGGTVDVFFVVATVIVSIIIAGFIARCLFGSRGASSRHRHTLLMIGLCGSGKTTLFAQLVARKCVSTRTSMEPNRAAMKRRAVLCSTDKGVFPSVAPSMLGNGVDASVVVVDFPGHRRLRESLLPALEEAKNVVVVVDAVTIQDDRHEGAQALAELLLSVFTSSAFYGVQRVLVACTKRDELTSYSAKAVRKLLEVDITRCITSRQGDLQSLDNILNSAGVVVGRSKNNSGSGRSSCGRDCRAHQLSLGEAGKFTFDAFPVPVQFVDVSSMVDPSRHPFNVEPVWDFVEGRI